ncbi:translation initiation factor eIF-2B subunit epsilon [Histomonas meleagridis]|uniref:translation initiation factor eIF-2B subunit epsilon n=1 Tax=Histomonas meleagridis TaxID=135588 RepID=UPI00355A0013|nr:translation initiation factor eIF-2B subunit epsilon [Histomonas meleagridis]KAH0804363.1 translation initiation factor eIF-2B subunit epsilon [Histomonas meleagridis]
MPPKQRKGNKTNNEADQYQEKQKNVTVGIVLCHPMECSLSPITNELPPCLFPICNSPVLLYTLNWLNVNGIEKIYILCDSRHVSSINSVVDQCRKRLLMDSIDILDTTDKIYTIGDAMRWIDFWNQNSNAFKNCVIVQGNLITNVPLAPIIAEHKKRVESATVKDYEPVLTTVFTQSSTDGYTVVANDSNMILHVQSPPILPLPLLSPNLKIDPHFFKSSQAVRVKTCLNDSKIYICTSQLLANFKDSFDWHNVLNDCIPSMIRSLDLLNHASYASFAPNCFSACIDDLPSYISATLAIVRRWIYPVTVEMNFFSPYEAVSLCYETFDDDESQNQTSKSNEVTSYHLGRDLVYLHDNVFPSLTSKIGHSVVIGSETQLCDNCVVRNSTIGCGCYIGKGVVIENSIIWDHVHIEDGAHITNSLIASKCNIAANVNISFGCILSFESIVDVDLPPCRRLTILCSQEEEDGEGFGFVEHAPKWLKDYVNEKEPLDLPEESYTYEFIPYAEHELPLLRMWLQIDHDTFPVDESVIAYDNDMKHKNNDDLMDEEEVIEESDDGEIVALNKDFQEDASSLLKSILNADSNIDIDQLRSEFVSLKNSKYAEHIDCAVALMLAIVEHWGKDLIEGIDLLGSLLKSFLNDIDEQQDFLFWWQSYCAKTAQKDLFMMGLKPLVNKGIITYDALDKWADEQDDCNEQQKELYDIYTETEI